MAAFCESFAIHVDLPKEKWFKYNPPIEVKWGLLERIKHNSEDWEIDEGKESCIMLKFDCVKSFM